MITQYKLILNPDRSCQPRVEWGYRLYASLLKQAPEYVGENVHEDAVTPISQFLTCDGDNIVWTVSLLGERCERSLSEVLDRVRSFDLTRERICMQVVERDCVSIPNVETLLEMAAAHSGVHRLRFQTATAFKSRGEYLNLPTTRLIVQNLLKKWNGCILECPIDDEDGQGMEALAAGLRCRIFHLHDQTYYLKGQAIPGFAGTITLENCLSGFHRQLADALLIFAEYSGIGIKTTLGMGGVTKTN